MTGPVRTPMFALLAELHRHSTVWVLAVWRWRWPVWVGKRGDYPAIVVGWIPGIGFFP